MKNKYHFAILFSALALFASGLAHGQSINSVYRQGVTLYDQQNYADALIQFERILKVNPRYTPALAYRNKCRTALAQTGGGTRAMEKVLAGVIIPSIKFAEVPLGDALTYIRQRTPEITGGKVNPNFIFNGTTEQKQNLLVTMELRQVPVTTLLGYIGKQTRCKIQYDQHAIMVTPYDSVTGSAPAAKVDAGTQLKNTFE